MLGFQISRQCWIVALLFATPQLPVLAAQQSAQPQLKNSTRKIRVQPSEQAQRIGTAVLWQPDLETALAKSRETGKPVFWYVPTINGTFMDRKPEIDRYMLAGPFSWPHVIEDLNQRFVPLRQPPTERQQAKYDCLLYTSPSPRDATLSRMPSSA